MKLSAIPVVLISVLGMLAGNTGADPDPSFDPHVGWTSLTESVGGMTVPTVVTPLCDDFLTRYAGAGKTPLNGCHDVVNTQGKDLGSINSQYGPRRMSGAGPTNEFHRGIDLAYHEMTQDDATPGAGPALKPAHARPVFAVRGGTVHMIKYTHDDDNPALFDGYSITLKHTDENGKTFYTYYKHFWAIHAKTSQNGAPISNDANGSATVADCGVDALTAPWLFLGAPITTGQFLGCTGYSSGKHHHLHFEVRVKANYNRNAVHPLRLYHIAADYQYVYEEDHASGRMKVTFVPKMKGGGNTSPVRVAPQQLYQGGASSQHMFVTDHGYIVYPSYVDLELLNHQYTHIDAAEGANCPFPEDHVGSFSADWHFKDGAFNGTLIEEQVTNLDAGDDTYYERSFTITTVVNWSGCPAVDVTFPFGSTKQVYAGECFWLPPGPPLAN